MNKILFFAHLRDAVGEESIEIEGNGKTVAELKQQMAETYDLKVDTVMVSINEEFAPWTTSFKTATRSPLSHQLVAAD